METFRPYRPQTPYAPGYGAYPVRPGAYMNGLGDIVMQPGSMYGAWGYGRDQSPYGSWGYGVYGLGQNGEAATPPPTAGGGAELEYGARLAFDVGIPVATGLVGIGVGLLIGYFTWGR